MRYKEYKKVDMQWFDEVPSHWEIKKFKRLTKNIGMGRTFLNANLLDYRSEKTIPVYSATQNDKILGYTYDKSLLLKQGDIVIPARGNSIGYAKLIKENEATCSQTTIYCKVKDIDNKFLYYSCYGFKDNWFYFTDTAIPQITVKQVENNYVPIPSKNEQEQIARFLDWKINEIDDLIRIKNTTLKKIIFMKKSFITSMITKGQLNIDNIKNVRLKNLCNNIIDGTHFTPEYQKEGIPFLRVTDISQLSYNDEINLSEVKRISKEEHNNLIKRCNPQKGDVLVSKNGSIGIPMIVDWNWEFSIFVSLCLLKLNNNVIPEWIYYYFLSSLVELEIAKGGKKGTIVNLHLDKIREFQVPLPSIKEQIKIVGIINSKIISLDELKLNVEKQIDNLKQLKQSLISDAVTGRIDVSNVHIPNYEKVNDIEDDTALEENFEEEV